MTKTWGIVLAGATIAFAAGCEDSTSTTGAGGSTSSTTGTGTTTSTTTTTASNGSTTSTASGSGSGSSTGSIMTGNCTPSGSMSGASADCTTICNAILAPQCPNGPGDLQECLDACSADFPACPLYDNFIDCGGEDATWSCSMTQSGVMPSKCAAEWACMEAMCFGGG